MPNFSDFVADAEQESNIPGIRRMWKVLSKNFVSEFPTKASVVNGEITQNALAVLPTFFVPAQYEVVINTTRANDNMDGDQGFMDYQQSIGFNTAGLNAAIKSELIKDLNAKAVYFFEDTDGQILVAGTSNKGLVAKTSGSTGQGGTNNDRRGNTITAEGRGFRWPILPLINTARSLFLNRIKGYDDIFYDRVTGITVSWGTSHTFTVFDEKAFITGDRIKIRMYGVGMSNSPWLAWGTITNITPGPSSDTRSIEIQLDTKPAPVGSGHYSSIRYYTLYTMATDVKNTQGATMVAYEEFV